MRLLNVYTDGAHRVMYFAVELDALDSYDFWALVAVGNRCAGVKLDPPFYRDRRYLEVRV